MMKLKTFIGAVVASSIITTAAFSGPKEDAFALIEQFKKGFDASDPSAIVKLFAKDAIFLGTLMQSPTTQSDEILKYFDSLSVDKPRRVDIENYQVVQLSESAFVFSGMNKFFRTKEGKELEAPARFTFVVTKGPDGWRISHFHSSVRPKP